MYRDFFEPDDNENTKFSVFDRIYNVVRQIPKGKVATYGQVAEMAGNKRWARVVGYALHVNPEPDKIPCFRVVNREGRVSEAFAFGGVNRQIELLKAEGVEFTGEDGKCVDLKKFQWGK
ncbi:MAG: MGMT family protein [Clostridia bacterium]|nr:MGMT family protein [Clostridia bacterium]